MIQLVRQDAMSASVSWQKKDLPPRELAAEDRVGRWTEGSFDDVFAGVGETFDLVKAAAADDADGWVLHRDVLRRRLGKSRSRTDGKFARGHCGAAARKNLSFRPERRR